jgi:hypothetical protein
MTSVKSSLSVIQNRWREHCAAPFPEEAVLEEICGICLVTLDSFSAGCIDAFLSNSGNLDKARLRVLESCSRDLAFVYPELNGGVREYFSRLQELARMVLQVMGGVKHA